MSIRLPGKYEGLVCHAAFNEPPTKESVLRFLEEKAKQVEPKHLLFTIACAQAIRKQGIPAAPGKNCCAYDGTVEIQSMPLIGR